MKIAVIEDSSTYKNVLKKIIKETTSWEVDFFSDASHFGREAKLSDYSIIIIDFHLPGINGRELLKSISNKTKAQLALMTSKTEWISEEDLNNGTISTIIEKMPPNKVIDSLKYLEAKAMINKYTETEEKNMEEMINLTNGNGKKE